MFRGAGEMHPLGAPQFITNLKGDKMAKRFVCLLAAIMIMNAHRAMSQEFRVPENYKFKSQDDYTHNEPDILRCIDFLENAPMDHDGRKAANAFLLQWLTGTARVSVTVQPYVMGLVEENKDLLAVYLGGWSRVVLQNASTKDMIDCHVAAVQSVLRAYRHCSGIEQDDALDDLVALEKEGKLREWVVKQVNSK
jgi:hypothetical protein